MTSINSSSDSHSGAIERIDGSGIYGWCTQHQLGNESVKLLFICNNVEIYNLQTQKIRSDIISKTDGNPTLSGFSLHWHQLPPKVVEHLIQCLRNTEENVISIRTECHYFLSTTWATFNNKISPNIDIINSLESIQTSLTALAPDKHGIYAKNRKSLRILLMTAHFEHLAGSEIVLLELAEYLSHEHDVTIAVAMSDSPVADYVKKLKVPIVRIDGNLRPFEYDFVWIQNYLLPLCDLTESPAMVEQTCFVFAHLDLNWGLAQAGIILEPILADQYVVHSPSGITHFADAGLDRSKIVSLFNAAPNNFFVPPRPFKPLQRIALISNHPPKELVEAQVLLQQAGLEVVHYGIGGDIENQRITPEVLKSYDAVISIGKSVQYCLGMKTPIFIYDKFGGPGYLSNENIDRAGWFNFSGRCCHRLISAQMIAEEIISGYSKAQSFAKEIADELLGTYRLEPAIDRLLTRRASAEKNQARLKKLALHADLIKREKALCGAAIHYFRSTLWITKEFKKYKENNSAVD